MNQLTFAWPETDSAPPIAHVASSKQIPIGIAAPSTSDHGPSKITESKIILTQPLTTARRGRPEHISDLLLVVLDRYGISPDEFLAGLQ